MSAFDGVAVLAGAGEFGDGVEAEGRVCCEDRGGV